LKHHYLFPASKEGTTGQENAEGVDEPVDEEDYHVNAPFCISKQEEGRDLAPQTSSFPCFIQNCNTIKPSPDSVIVEDGIKDAALADTKRFLQTEEWYVR